MASRRNSERKHAIANLLAVSANVLLGSALTIGAPLSKSGRAGDPIQLFERTQDVCERLEARLGPAAVEKLFGKKWFDAIQRSDEEIRPGVAFGYDRGWLFYRCLTYLRQTLAVDSATPLGAIGFSAVLAGRAAIGTLDGNDRIQAIKALAKTGLVNELQLVAGFRSAAPYVTLAIAPNVAAVYDNGPPHPHYQTYSVTATLDHGQTVTDVADLDGVTSPAYAGWPQKLAAEIVDNPYPFSPIGRDR